MPLSHISFSCLTVEEDKNKMSLSKSKYSYYENIGENTKSHFKIKSEVYKRFIAFEKDDIIFTNFLIFLLLNQLLTCLISLGNTLDAPHWLDMRRFSYPPTATAGPLVQQSAGNSSSSNATHIPGVYPPSSLANDLLARERERLERLGKSKFSSFSFIFSFIFSFFFF